jgi:flavin-dependent dehydrogenase
MAPWTDRVEVSFGRGAEAYVTPVDQDLIQIAFLFEPPGSFETLLGRFPRLAARIRGRLFVTPARGAGPFEQRVARRVAGRVLLVGDAAGYVDPITGEGVALGMATGRAAATAIADGAPERYEAEWRALTRRHRFTTNALVRVVRHAASTELLLRCAAACPALFEAGLAHTALVPRDRRATAAQTTTKVDVGQFPSRSPRPCRRSFE